MRRAVLAILIIAVVICCLAIANAASLISHEVEKTDVSISVPDSWYYADYGISDADPLYQVYGLPADQFKQQLDELDCSLIMISDDTGCYLSLFVEDSELTDLSGFTDKMLITLGNTYSDELSGLGYDVVSVRTAYYNLPFVKIRYNDNEAQYYEYITIKNNKRYIMNVTSYTDISSYVNVIDKIMGSLSIGSGFQECYIEDVQMHLFVPSEYHVLDEAERLELNASGKYLFYSYNADESFKFHVDLIDKDVGMQNLNLFSESELNSFAMLLSSLIQLEWCTESIAFA